MHLGIGGERLFVSKAWKRLEARAHAASQGASNAIEIAP
jgi:hypothetical protein